MLKLTHEGVETRLVHRVPGLAKEAAAYEAPEKLAHPQATELDRRSPRADEPEIVQLAEVRGHALALLLEELASSRLERFLARPGGVEDQFE